jgi:hypothetical protein
MSKKITSDKRAKVISVVMPPDIIDSVDRLRGNHYSRSTYLKMAVLEKMRREEKLYEKE